MHTHVCATFSRTCAKCVILSQFLCAKVSVRKFACANKFTFRRSVNQVKQDFKVLLSNEPYILTVLAIKNTQKYSFPLFPLFPLFKPKRGTMVKNNIAPVCRLGHYHIFVNLVFTDNVNPGILRLKV